MNTHRLTLVGSDYEFTRALQVHFRSALALSIPLIAPDEAAARLGGDAGLLVLATDRTEDTRSFARLLRRVADGRMPAVAVVAGEAVAAHYRSNTSPQWAHLFCWPEDAPLLEGYVRARFAATGGTADPAGPLADAIARRLGQQTPSLQMMAEALAKAASHDMTVLMTGETGTGKTFLARLIHEYSPRRHHRLLMVPCGSLAAGLVESEFFGHVKGAFTSADQAKEGKFAAAGHGTLLLDEIDALGLDQQSNLLRVIETGEYEPVGSNRTEICSARIIAASNLNLEEAVEAGRFRQDLYYRLNVMSFYLPPLRERVEDIRPLSESLVARCAARFHRPVEGITSDAVSAMEAFPWPGNIRQLENVIQHAVLMGAGPRISLRDLPQPLQRHAPPASTTGVAPSDTLAYNRERAERAVIERALNAAGGNRARAARVLGISRVTLYKKLNKYGLMKERLQPT